MAGLWLPFEKLVKRKVLALHGRRRLQILSASLNSLLRQVCNNWRRENIKDRPGCRCYDSPLTRVLRAHLFFLFLVLLFFSFLVFCFIVFSWFSWFFLFFSDRLDSQCFALPKYQLRGPSSFLFDFQTWTRLPSHHLSSPLSRVLGAHPLPAWYHTWSGKPIVVRTPSWSE